MESKTEKHFTTVKITKVIEKKMGELKKGDKQGHEKFNNNDEMYKTYSGYYKKDVTPDTIAKIVWFKPV